MANTKDAIPKRDADFDGWLANLARYVTEKTQAKTWPHIPAEKVTALAALAAAWHTAYAKTTGPHTPVDTESKNDARKAAEAALRPFVAQYLKFDPVTNEDRLAMRLHNRDTTHTPIGRPASRALLTELRALGGFQVEIRFHDEASPDSRAIPYGCNGCLLNFAFAGEKLSEYAALSRSQLMTRSPFTLSLPPEAEGAFLSCAVRWQSERGELGPWSEVLHVAVA